MKENYLEEIIVAGRKIKVVSKQKLLEMKKSIQPLREKDIFDISIIIKILKAEEKQNEAFA